MTLNPRMRTWLFAGLSLLVVAYLVVAWMITSSAADNRLCQGVLITVHDTSEIHFVTPQELAGELGTLPQTARKTRISDIDVDSIERLLSNFDKIERVNVNILSSGQLLVDVWPMRPVARIFDASGHSYYINRAGKRIAADPRYYLDVPVIQGEFSPDFKATSLIPVLDYLAEHPDWGEAVTMLQARGPNDIILVPAIRGHVINLGDTTDLPDKFRRLRLMYSKVLGVKGWDYYKELSVKWRGQVVGIQRNAKARGPEYLTDEENAEETSLSAVQVDEGAHTPTSAEKPIPAARTRPDKPKADSVKTAAPKPDKEKSTDKKSDKPKQKPQTPPKP